MINLASNRKGAYCFLKDIARIENISEKYLSQIVIPLRRAGLLITGRGIHGGYRLSRDPSLINARDIIEALEGDLDLIDCAKDEAICASSAKCAGRDMWAQLSLEISNFLESVTLKELAKKQSEKASKYIEYSI